MSAAFLFQRSMRLDDNRGFSSALQYCATKMTTSGRGEQAGDDGEKETISSTSSSLLLPLFCVDPRQADPSQNPFFSPFSLGFMLDSLTDLRKELEKLGSTLLLTYGEAHVAVPPVLKLAGVEKLFVNADLTPFAKQRAVDLRAALKPVGIELVEIHNDHLLHDFGSILKSNRNGTQQQVPRGFFPFKEECIKAEPSIRRPEYLVAENNLERHDATTASTASPASSSPLQRTLMPAEVIRELVAEKDILTQPAAPTTSPSATSPATTKQQDVMPVLKSDKAWSSLQEHSRKPPFVGGRTEGLKILKNLPIAQSNYHKDRNNHNYATTHLSSYLKFGCLSPREVWFAMGRVGGQAGAKLQDELIWREFYNHYFAAYPDEMELDSTVVKGKSIQEIQALDASIAKHLSTKTNPACKQSVADCFKMLDTTGFINNKARLMIGHYLLEPEEGANRYWKEGDLLFARRLVDYDPFQNIGGWTWIQKRHQQEQQQQQRGGRGSSGSGRASRGGYGGGGAPSAAQVTDSSSTRNIDSERQHRAANTPSGGRGSGSSVKRKSRLQ